MRGGGWWDLRDSLATKRTLTAVDYDKWKFQIWSWIESQHKSKGPGDPHDNCQFQYNQ